MVLESTLGPDGFVVEPVFERHGHAAMGDVDAGNFSEFKLDGSLQFHGDATTFRDEFGDITKLKVVGTGISETLAEGTVGLMTSCSYVDDYLVSNFQFNHDRKLAAAVYAHVHWFQDQAAVPNFLVQYRWQKNGSAKVSDWTNLIMKSNAFAYVSGTLVQITYGVGILPPADDAVSPIVQVRITRDKTNASGAFAGSDTHNATAELLSFDIHVESDSVGSKTQYTK